MLTEEFDKADEVLFEYDFKCFIKEQVATV